MRMLRSGLTPSGRAGSGLLSSEARYDEGADDADERFESDDEAREWVRDGVRPDAGCIMRVLALVCVVCRSDVLVSALSLCSLMLNQAQSRRPRIRPGRRDAS